MIAHRRKMAARLKPALAVLMVAGAVILPPAGASAEGLFGAFFDALSGRPPAAQAYADPRSPNSANPLADLFGLNNNRPPQASKAPAAGRGVSYCVRLCDGRFFPMQRHAGATPAQLCGSMCPASKTKIFSGSTIDGAAAQDGSRYADLENAFAYRQRVVSDCTCNGKDAFGLAPIDVAADPTLREGDIVATPAGFMAYSSRTRRGNEIANFTPVDPSRMARDLRDKLAAITPATAN